MQSSKQWVVALSCVIGFWICETPAGWAQNDTPTSTQAPKPQEPSGAFELGQFVVVTTEDVGEPGIAGTTITGDQMRTFNRNTLDQAVNLAPGVSSTMDANGRRNESDIFVRGFGRWQVPLMVDGVRIYLPADNRLDFGRFLTSDITAIQIQKGFASVLDGPGAMGGAINLVTRKPVRRFESEGGISVSGRSTSEAWDSYLMLGTRQKQYYLQGSLTYTDRDFWSLPGSYSPTATSMQPGEPRMNSDNEDWRVNLKAGYTPNAKNEYVFNYTRQVGEKGAPLNIYNNPQIPANSFWRWPWWNVQNMSVLSTTQIDDASYIKAKVYYNTFKNGLNAFDDITYTTQSNNGRFRSFYDDYAGGTSIELGTSHLSKNAVKGAFHYRADRHAEWNFNRPTHPTLASTEPRQRQQQRTWSIALEDTFQLTPDVDFVGGLSYDKYAITRAEEYSSGTASIFEYPHANADSVNWQAAAIWRYSDVGRVHVSISDRARFPVLFELYSTRLGSGTPNPGLGPERATNIEVGWKRTFGGSSSFSGALFLSDVRNLIQPVQLPDTTFQSQNIGNGHFYGLEFSGETSFIDWISGGVNYTVVRRVVNVPSSPPVQLTGVPTQKAFLYATLSPVTRLAITPSIEFADNRWSELTTSPAAAFPYIRTGAYTLVNANATYAFPGQLEVSVGVKNLFDDYYELGWGLPQSGRTFYLKTRATF